MELIPLILFGLFIFWLAYDEAGSFWGAVGAIIIGIIVLFIIAKWIEATGGDVNAFEYQDNYENY